MPPAERWWSGREVEGTPSLSPRTWSDVMKILARQPLLPALLLLSVLTAACASGRTGDGRGDPNRLTVAEIEDWKDKFLAAAENALRSRPKDEDTAKAQEIKKLKEKVGELVIDLDILREAVKDRPFEPRTFGD